MSHFMCYTHRLEKAGIFSLWISLGADKEGLRLMHVSPDASVPRELAAKYPTRTFRIDGTDTVLEGLIDDMVYSDAGATPEKVQAAIDAHPLQADDLRDWFASWLLFERAEKEEIERAPTPQEEADMDASVARTGQWIKGVLRGIDITRTREAHKA